MEPTRLNIEHFIQHDAEVRQTLPKRRACTRCLQIIISIFREFAYRFNICRIRLCNRTWAFEKYTKPNWQKDSQGLFVFIHGLNGHPLIWNESLADLESKKGYDKFVPNVYKKGNCNLEEAVRPIFEALVSYAKSHPNKPICITGVSNGVRIGLLLDKMLRSSAENTAVRVNAIAGAHFGSERMDIVKKSTLLVKAFGYTPPIVEALTYRSDSSNALLGSVLERSPADPVRSYKSYMSSSDLHIPKLDTLLPPHQPQPFIVNGHSHNSVVNAVRRVRLVEDLAWMSAVATANP